MKSVHHVTQSCLIRRLGLNLDSYGFTVYFVIFDASKFWLHELSMNGRKLWENINNHLCFEDEWVWNEMRVKIFIFGSTHISVVIRIWLTFLRALGKGRDLILFLRIVVLHGFRRLGIECCRGYVFCGSNPRNELSF